MEGWVKIHRKIVENPYYFSEAFTRSQAWIDLIILANHKENFFYKRGVKVNVNIGQVGYDLDSLGKRWKWSRGKVERFINELEKDNQVVRQKTNVTTLISIVKYKDYQTDSKAKDKPNSKADGHQTVKQTEANKNEKNENNEKKEEEEEKIINIDFLDFWDLYNKKQGDKESCENKWNKLKDIDRQKIIDTLPVFLSKIKDKQFQPLPATYLNQKRWNDEIIENKQERKMIW